MSHSFTTRDNKRWTMSITVGTVKRVKALTGFELLAIIDRPNDLAELASDPVRFVDVLFSIIKPDADAAGITDEMFAEALDGDAIEAATAAFLEALVDFFPGARKATLRRVLTRATEATAKADLALTTALADGTIDAAIERALIGSATATN